MGLMQFEEGLRQHLADPEFPNAATSPGAQQLCDWCDKWLSAKPTKATPSPADIWQACVNALEQASVVPSAKAARKSSTINSGLRMISVVARTRSLVDRDTARAADFVLVLARLFASSAAHEHAAKACLYAIEACPCLIAELTYVPIPDHAPEDGAAERWRETDFAKTVDMLLDSATRARVPLGQELGKAIVRHRIMHQFEHSILEGKQDVADIGRYNVRGVCALHPRASASHSFCIAQLDLDWRTNLTDVTM